MLQMLLLAVSTIGTHVQPENDFASLSCSSRASADPTIVVRIMHRGKNIERINDNNLAVTAVRLDVRDEQGKIVVKNSLPYALDWSDKRARSLRPGDAYTLRFSPKRDVTPSENIPLSEFGYRPPNGAYTLKAQPFLSWDNAYSSPCIVHVKR